MTVAQRMNRAELFSERENDIDYSRFNIVRDVLNRDISQIEFENLWSDWNEFCISAEMYRNSIVVDMIYLYLDERA